MDNQFNTLIRSYRDNYLEYKITGDTKYQNAYMAAKDGIQRLLDSLQDAVDTQKRKIADFYKSGAEQDLIESDYTESQLRQDMIAQSDALKAAELRVSTPAPSFSLTTTQKITMGVLGGVSIVLMMV